MDDAAEDADDRIVYAASRDPDYCPQVNDGVDENHLTVVDLIAVHLNSIDYRLMSVDFAAVSQCCTVLENIEIPNYWWVYATVDAAQRPVVGPEC